jgi:hypothetical protein
MSEQTTFTEALHDLWGDLGDDVTNGATTIKGRFRNEFISVNNEESMMPVVKCLDADVTAIVHGTSLVIALTTYKVIGIQPNGNGTTTLMLSKD